MCTAGNVGRLISESYSYNPCEVGRVLSGRLMAISNNADDDTAPDSNAWEVGPHRRGAGTGVAEKAEQERRTLSRRVLLLCRLSILCMRCPPLSSQAVFVYYTGT